MLARLPIQAWTKPRVAETSQQRQNGRESTQESSDPPRLNLALKISSIEEAVGRLSGARLTLSPHRATAALDPNQTLRSPKGLPLALPGARQRRPARVPRAQIGLVCYITPRVAPRGSSGAGATTDSRGRGFPGLRSRQIESDAPPVLLLSPRS